MSERKYERTRGELLGFYQKENGGELETPKGNINYLCVKACGLDMVSQIANLSESNFIDEVKHLNALHLIKCWNMHAKFAKFMTEIATSEQPPHVAMKTIERKAKRLLTEALK